MEQWKCAAWEFLFVNGLYAFMVNWSTAAPQKICMCCMFRCYLLNFVHGYFVLTFLLPFLWWCGHIFEAFYTNWHIMTHFNENTCVWRLQLRFKKAIWAISCKAQATREYSIQRKFQRFSICQKNQAVLNPFKKSEFPNGVCCK